MIDWLPDTAGLLELAADRYDVWQQVPGHKGRRVVECEKIDGRWYRRSDGSLVEHVTHFRDVPEGPEG